jgi:hypothetical protein
LKQLTFLAFFISVISLGTRYLIPVFKHTVERLWAVMWIRIGFNADPDSAFYLGAVPDPSKPNQC